MRQQDYVYAFNIPSAYTPQMVVDGAAQFVGSDAHHVVAAIAQAARTPKANLQIQQRAGAASGPQSLLLRVSLAPPSGSNAKHGADVLLAITEDDLPSNVTAGENAGAHMNHRAVVRELRVLGRVDSSGAFSAAPGFEPGPQLETRESTRSSLHARPLDAANPRRVNALSVRPQIRSHGLPFLRRGIRRGGCPAHILGVILAIRHPLDGIFAFASVAAASLFRRAFCLCFVGAQHAVPGKHTWLLVRHPPPTPGRASSFRAECPALLPLREAPGHAVEESLFDVTTSSTHTKIGVFVYVAHPAFTG